MKIIDFLKRKGISKYLNIGILIIVILMSRELKSQDISTIGEIYDYEVNDIFHFEYEGGDGYNGEKRINNIEIINKYYSQDNDTLFYVRDIDSKTISSWNPIWTYQYYVDTIRYTNLDSLIHSGQIDTVYSRIDKYHGRLINEYVHDVGNYYLNSKYVVGCGNAEWYSFNTGGGESSEYLKYYKKGSEEWGQPLIVSIKNLDLENHVISIYPNPAKTSIHIESDIPTNGYVSIYSMNGSLINEFYFINKSSTFDISTLKTGLYVFEFKYTDQTIYKRIIKE